MDIINEGNIHLKYVLIKIFYFQAESILSNDSLNNNDIYTIIEALNDAVRCYICDIKSYEKAAKCYVKIAECYIKIDDIYPAASAYDRSGYYYKYVLFKYL